MAEPDVEDGKLLMLARATLGRLRVPSAAAVRDDTGRTYVAAVVDLPSLRLSALQAAVAMAMASGATGLEAAVLVSAVGGPPDPQGIAAVHDLGGPTVAVYAAGTTGDLGDPVEIDDPGPA